MNILIPNAYRTSFIEYFLRYYAILYRISSNSENLCDEQRSDNRNITCENNDVREAEIDMNSPAWLHSSSWNPSYETVVLVHGYGGTSDYLPTGILKDGTF